MKKKGKIKKGKDVPYTEEIHAAAAERHFKNKLQGLLQALWLCKYTLEREPGMTHRCAGPGIFHIKFVSTFKCRPPELGSLFYAPCHSCSTGSRNFDSHSSLARFAARMMNIIRTKSQEHGKTILAQYEDNLQRRFSESPECDATCQGCTLATECK